jgi:hypothetical protein
MMAEIRVAAPSQGGTHIMSGVPMTPSHPKWRDVMWLLSLSYDGPYGGGLFAFFEILENYFPDIDRDATADWLALEGIESDYQLLDEPSRPCRDDDLDAA